MKKILFIFLFLFAVTGCQVNKEVSNDDLESPPTPSELGKNNSKLQTPPDIPELKNLN